MRRRSLARIRVDRGLPVVSVPDRVAPPLVSVVIATYNRSNVLRAAIASVRDQIFQDWELIVVGDACTDDTAAVVASFGDQRITFVNLEQNFGDQSAPNSIGARAARGRYIAWLNHDDLWFPDHLASMVEVVERTGATFVLTANYRVLAIDRLDSGKLTGTVELSTIPDRFLPWGGTLFQASSWLVAAEIVRRLGDWRAARTLRYASSQQYLYRAWSAGARFALSGQRTLVVVPSIVGEHAYKHRRDSEQAIVAPLVRSVDRAAFDQLVHPGAERHRLFWPAREISVPRRLTNLFRRALRRYSAWAYLPTAAPLAFLGVPTWEYAAFLAGVRRGGTNAILRGIRGLEQQEPASAARRKAVPSSSS